MGKIVLSLIQLACNESFENNISKATERVREAANNGANIIVLPELFEGPYFPQNYNPEFFSKAEIAESSDFLNHFARLARECEVVLPISFFEKMNNSFYNSVLVIDADGTKLGVYRKTHIPDDPGYYEKYYFTPGDTGFRVWDTKHGRIGVGICWDQWYPESARIMALKGAEVIVFPTAIGYHTNKMTPDCSEHWMLTMRGHAAANMVPIAAVNRVGIESGLNTEIDFFGNSFITDGRGKIIERADNKNEEILYGTLDLDEIRRDRDAFLLFRDRRPEMYHAILTKDGKTINNCL